MIINTTFNELTEQNNVQVKINSMVNSRIKDMTKAINNLINQQNLENKVILQEYDALTLMLYIDTTNDILKEIQDTIIRTKISLPNNKILSLKEILIIESILQEQGITTEFPEEALNYVEPKIVSNHETLLYILQVPQLQKESSEVIQILPLICNDIILIDLPSFIVRSGNIIYSTTKPENFVQRFPEISVIEDNCITNLLVGKTSNCKAMRENNTYINLMPDNRLLINNGKQSHIYTDCGPDNRTLTGNFLLTFINCTITISGKTFTSIQITNNDTRELPGAFSNLSIYRHIVEHHEIEAISNQTFSNRKQLNFINLKQYEHKIWILSMFGGISTTMIISVGVTAYVCLQKKKVIIKFRCPKQNTDTNLKTTTKDNKAEDVLFSPPGGVTNPPFTQNK